MSITVCSRVWSCRPIPWTLVMLSSQLYVSIQTWPPKGIKWRTFLRNANSRSLRRIRRISSPRTVLSRIWIRFYWGHWSTLFRNHRVQWDACTHCWVTLVSRGTQATKINSIWSSWGSPSTSNWTWLRSTPWWSFPRRVSIRSSLPTTDHRSRRLWTTWIDVRLRWVSVVWGGGWRCHSRMPMRSTRGCLWWSSLSSTLNSGSTCRTSSWRRFLIWINCTPSSTRWTVWRSIMLD